MEHCHLHIMHEFSAILFEVTSIIFGTNVSTLKVHHNAKNAGVMKQLEILGFVN